MPRSDSLTNETANIINGDAITARATEFFRDVFATLGDKMPRMTVIVEEGREMELYTDYEFY